MISPLSHAAAAAGSAALGSGLPWWVWVIVILAVVVLLSFVFEKLEGKPITVSYQDSPRLESSKNVTPRQYPQSINSGGPASMRPTAGPPPTAMSQQVQSVHGPPTTYGTLATAKQPQQLPQQLPQTLPPSDVHSRKSSFTSASPGTPAFQPAVPVAPTHSMPVQQPHSFSSVTSSPKMGPAGSPTHHAKTFSAVPQTHSGVGSPMQPMTLPARAVSPPRLNSPTRSIGSGGFGTPVHGHPMAPGISQQHLQTYPNYGHMHSGASVSPPGTWPHNPAGMPLQHSSSYGSQKHH